MARRLFEAGPWTLFGCCEVVGVVVDDEVAVGQGASCVVIWNVADVRFTASAVMVEDGFRLDYEGQVLPRGAVTLVGAIVRWRRVRTVGD